MYKIDLTVQKSVLLHKQVNKHHKNHNDSMTTSKMEYHCTIKIYGTTHCNELN